MGRIIRGDLPAGAADVFFTCRENQLLHYYEPEPGLFMAESLTVIERALNSGYEPVMALMEEGRVLDAGAELLAGIDVPVYSLPEEQMRESLGYCLTGGALCAMRRKREPDPIEVLSGASRLAVLADVENPTNVGALFRSAAALGMEGVLLLGGCADPLQRRSIRVSMGNVFAVPWVRMKDAAAGMDVLAAAGFETCGLALAPSAVPLQEAAARLGSRAALILGNERNGIPAKVLEKCDLLAVIPMHAGADSLNVATAGAVAFWELTRERKWN